MDRYIYLLNYFNIVNSTLDQKNEKYAKNIREANHLILNGELNDSEKKTLLNAMGDFVGASKMKGDFLIDEDAIQGIYELNFGQTEFLKAIKSEDNYSFSMPTSFGKSFLAKKMAEEITKLQKRVLFVVPTLALMYEYFNDLSNLKPSTTIDDSKVSILTQERALFYDFKSSDYIIFDEAYESFEDEVRSVLTSKIIVKAIEVGAIVKMMSPNLRDPTVIIPPSVKHKFNSFVLNHTLTSRDIIATKNKDQLIKKIANDSDKWICYCKKGTNSIKMIELAKELIANSKNNKIVENCLIDEYLKNEYNKNFLLVKFLKNGIAIHNGDIPKDIRFIFEILFKKNNLNKIVANTTLVRGVNLKANKMAIFDNGTGGNFTDFMIRNLIGRVGRYGDSGELKLRHGEIHVVESNKLKISDFNKINDLNLMNYEKASNKNNQIIEKLKSADCDFNPQANQKKNILDYHFSEKDIVVSWIKNNVHLFKKERATKFLSNENIDKITEIFILMLNNMRDLQTSVKVFKKFHKDEYDSNKKDEYDSNKIKSTLTNIINNHKPYVSVVTTLKHFAEENPLKKLKDEILKEKSITHEELLLEENSEYYEMVVFSRVMGEMSKRNAITDYLLTKLNIAVADTLGIANIDLNGRDEKVAKEMKNSGIPEVFYNSYKNLKENHRAEIKRLCKYFTTKIF